jgi:hypothetical protein
MSDETVEHCTPQSLKPIEMAEVALEVASSTESTTTDAVSCDVSVQCTPPVNPISFRNTDF